MLNEVTPAQIKIQPDGTPFAEIFDDPYFSKHDGLAESRYVFIQGNHLPEKWQHKLSFVIAETGFGTGLNFLATWQTWHHDPDCCDTLHYISIEKHPIVRDELASLLKNWPELSPFSTELLAQYPPALAGFHTLWLANGKIRLTLCFMDIIEALSELNLTVNAWYLDGFAPARNEAMWSESVCNTIASLSEIGTSFATFTVAGQVRNNLQNAGFQIEKKMGFAQKRHMLTGHLVNNIEPATLLPWFARPQTSFNKKAIIIGAGIAGCQIAYALAQRGWEVTILERNQQLAHEASGNRAGVIIPKMTAEADWGERFYRTAFLFTLRQLDLLAANIPELPWNKCGSIQLNHDERETKRWLALKNRALPKNFLQLLEVHEINQQAGINLEKAGSYFPDGAWINPASWCAALLNHPLINLQLNTPVSGLNRTKNGWQVYTETGFNAETEVVIIASGQEAARFEQTCFLPLIPVRGQTSHAQASAHSAQLQVTVGHEGYVTPAWQGVHVFGATFERDEYEAVCDSQRDVQNVEQLATYLPEFARTLGEVSSGHCAIRVTAPDRYPCVGAVPDPDDFKQRYAAIRHGQQHQTWSEVRYQTGLYISAAYGSRGLTTSALCSELLASLINGEPFPLELSLYYKLHPARFLLRRLQQNRT